MRGHSACLFHLPDPLEPICYMTENGQEASFVGFSFFVDFFCLWLRRTYYCCCSTAGARSIGGFPAWVDCCVLGKIHASLRRTVALCSSIVDACYLLCGGKIVAYSYEALLSLHSSTDKNPWPGQSMIVPSSWQINLFRRKVISPKEIFRRR